SGVRLRLAQPRIEIDNPICVVRLPKLHVPEATVPGYVAQDDLIIERRCLRAPAACADDRAGGLSRRYEIGIRGARPQAGDGDGWQCGGGTQDGAPSERDGRGGGETHAR